MSGVEDGGSGGRERDSARRRGERKGGRNGTRRFRDEWMR